MGKTSSISVTVNNLTSKRFEALCNYWGLSKSRCIEEIINKQFYELQYKDGVLLETDLPPNLDPKG